MQFQIEYVDLPLLFFNIGITIPLFKKILLSLMINIASPGISPFFIAVSTILSICFEKHVNIVSFLLCAISRVVIEIIDKIVIKK